MAGAAMSATLDLVRSVMTALATDPPLTFSAGADGVRMLTTMDEKALATRSRGPYDRDNSPWEAVAIAERGFECWPMVATSEKPEFRVELEAPWPRLTLEVPAHRLVVNFVVPEEVPSVRPPAAARDALSNAFDGALTFVARSLLMAGQRLGGEPPVSITLSRLDDPPPGDMAARGQDEPEHPDVLAAPTLQIDRGRCTREQRDAHDDALWSIADARTIERLGDRGFTARIGLVRVRDGGAPAR